MKAILAVICIWSAAPLVRGEAIKYPGWTLHKPSDGSRPSIGLGLTEPLNARLQNELFEGFQKKHPKLLANALASSGNINNPKVIPLRSVFDSVLLDTATVKEMNTVLKTHGLRISSCSHEKLLIEGKGEDRRFFAFIYLTVEPQP